MSKNIILIVLDTARADDSWYVAEHTDGNSTLASLADSGTTFTNATATAPWTLPSHASLFTGLFPSKHDTHAENRFLDGQYPTIADYLSNAGYETVAFTNNAWVTDEFGFSRGFDEMYKIWQYVQTDTDFGEIALTKHGLDSVVEAGKALFNGDILANAANAVYGQFLYRRNDYGAARTNELLRDWFSDREQENPFFLFVNYLEPHLDYQPPRDYAERYLPKDATYDEAMAVPQEPWRYVAGYTDLSERELDLLHSLYRAEIDYLDERLGELVTMLDDYTKADTVLFIVGDHGENIGDHGLMDHQYSLNETLLHVPFVVTGGAFANGETVEKPVQLTDVLPTVLESAGIELERDIQGVSLHSSSAIETDRPVFSEYIGPQPSMGSLRDQLGDLPDAVRRYDRGLRSIQIGTEKLIRSTDGNVELYDLETDPNEDRDIAASRTDHVKLLNSRLDEWLESFDSTTTREQVDVSGTTKQRLEELGYL